MTISKYSDLEGFSVEPADVSTEIGSWEDVEAQYFRDVLEMLSQREGPELWGLVCIRPDGDAFLLDMLGAQQTWLERMRRENLRRVVGCVIPISGANE